MNFFECRPLHTVSTALLGCQQQYQTKSFFLELLSQARSDGDNSELVNSAHLLFRSINENISSFFKDQNQSDQLDSFISLFIYSPINVLIAQDISTFMISLVFSNFYETPAKDSFRKTIGSFFESETFPPFFEASGGLFALWDLLLSENKKQLCDFVFGKIEKKQKIEHDFRGNFKICCCPGYSAGCDRAILKS